jgi:hypothetical protein
MPDVDVLAQCIDDAVAEMLATTSAQPQAGAEPAG